MKKSIINVIKVLVLLVILVPTIKVGAKDIPRHLVNDYFEQMYYVTMETNKMTEEFELILNNSETPYASIYIDKEGPINIHGTDGIYGMLHITDKPVVTAYIDELGRVVIRYKFKYSTTDKEIKKVRKDVMKDIRKDVKKLEKMNHYDKIQWIIKKMDKYKLDNDMAIWFGMNKDNMNTEKMIRGNTLTRNGAALVFHEYLTELNIKSYLSLNYKASVASERYETRMYLAAINTVEMEDGKLYSIDYYTHKVHGYKDAILFRTTSKKGNGSDYFMDSSVGEINWGRNAFLMPYYSYMQTIKDSLSRKHYNKKTNSKITNGLRPSVYGYNSEKVEKIYVDIGETFTWITNDEKGTLTWKWDLGKNGKNIKVNKSKFTITGVKPGGTTVTITNKKTGSTQTVRVITKDMKQVGSYLQPTGKVVMTDRSVSLGGSINTNGWFLCVSDFIEGGKYGVGTDWTDYIEEKGITFRDLDPKSELMPEFVKDLTKIGGLYNYTEDKMRVIEANYPNGETVIYVGTTSKFGSHFLLNRFSSLANYKLTYTERGNVDEVIRGKIVNGTIGEYQ